MGCVEYGTGRWTENERVSVARKRRVFVVVAATVSPSDRARASP